MVKLAGIKVRGYDFDKHGALVKKPFRQAVSERLRQKHSKRIKPVRRAARGI